MGDAQCATDGLLRAVPRKISSRAVRAIMDGEDLWRAWELSWVTERGMRRCGVLEIRVPASSPVLVESKSLKLYLFSLRDQCFASTDLLCAQVEKELSTLVGAPVVTKLLDIEAPGLERTRCPGTCLDQVERPRRSTTSLAPAKELLSSRRADSAVVSELLYTNLFRTLCPLSGHPDWATIAIRYRGQRVERGGLLDYLFGYAEHRDFHEHCVESIFGDLWTMCAPQELMVEGFFLRRGGIDICPRRFSKGHYPDARSVPRPLVRQ